MMTYAPARPAVARPVRPLENEDLRRLAPSIFAEHPHEGVSRQYRFLSTIAVVDLMRDRGYLPVRASQSTSRLDGRRDFVRHMVRFRQAADLDPMAVGDEVPEIVLSNSHDRSAAYRLMAGVFRLVCSNGMVVCSSQVADISVKHVGSGDLGRNIIDATARIADDTPRVIGQMGEFKQLQLPPPAQQAMARAALELRDGGGTINPLSLLQSRRASDRPDPAGNRSLWTTGNVIQEALTKGGVRGRSESGRRMTTRPIKAVDADIRTNRAVWKLMEEMAKLTG